MSSESISLRSGRARQTSASFWALFPLYLLELLDHIHKPFSARWGVMNPTKLGTIREQLGDYDRERLREGLDIRPVAICDPIS
jgi:hypothetical protein